MKCITTAKLLFICWTALLAPFAPGVAARDLQQSNSITEYNAPNTFSYHDDKPQTVQSFQVIARGPDLGKGQDVLYQLSS
jgi:hypothetical protein